MFCSRIVSTGTEFGLLGSGTFGQVVASQLSRNQLPLLNQPQRLMTPLMPQAWPVLQSNRQE